MEYIIYLKLNRNIRTKTTGVRIKDMGTVYCAQSGIKNKVENLKILDIPEDQKDKTVVSVLYVIEKINKALAGEKNMCRVESVGEQDCVISRMPEKGHGTLRERIEMALVSLTVFFGASFAIMTYNEDVDVRGVFGKMYEIFSGTAPEAGGVLELTYSIGIGIGLLIFFNHFEFGKKQRDPTPMEVQMCQYEEDVIHTVVESSERRGEEKDVD